MEKKAFINELTAFRAQAQELADRATVLIQKAGVQAPASLKNQQIKGVLDRRNAKIFAKTKKTAI